MAWAGFWVGLGLCILGLGLECGLIEIANAIKRCPCSFSSERFSKKS